MVLSCKQHDQPLHLICDMYMCSACYGEDLLTNTRNPRRDDDNMIFDRSLEWADPNHQILGEPSALLGRPALKGERS